MVWIILIGVILIGYIINLVIFLLSAMGDPTPSLREYKWKEILMYVIPFGPILILIFSFIFSPWIE